MHFALDPLKGAQSVSSGCRRAADYAKVAALFYRHCGQSGLWALAKTFTGSRIVEMRVPNTILRVGIRPHSVDRVTYREVFLEGIYRYEHYGNPKVIVDAGANIGLTSLYYSILFPAAKVLALEPDPGNFSLLRRNVKSRHQIEPMRRGLWTHETVLKLRNPDAKHDRFQYRESAEPGGSVVAEGVSIRWILRHLGVDRIDILKIDIEGAERHLFQTADEWLDKVSVLAIELHDGLVHGCSDAMFNALKGREYSISKRDETTFVRLSLNRVDSK
jgi:FkbM family methyltransferase